MSLHMTDKHIRNITLHPVLVLVKINIGIAYATVY